MKHIVKFVMISMLLLSSFVMYPFQNAEASTVLKNFQVSPGVFYANDVFSSSAGLSENTNQVTIDLNDPYSKVEVGVPNPLNHTATTTSYANSQSREGHRVVGAINGSFFDMKSKMPLYLIAQNNQMLNGGIISDGSDKYVNEPIAFGITSDGSAAIDYYDLSLRTSSKAGNFPISGYNRLRDSNEAILYTANNENGYTNANKYGVEYIVETDGPVKTPVEFGTTLKGTIKSIRQYGDAANTKIPENGFVLSVNGSLWLDRLKSLAVGDELTVSADIDDKWKNADFVLASGPMLVKDGKEFLTMDPNSSRARERTSRTAVAIDSSKKKVFFVTVDGKQSGFSSGMTLHEFAQYLISLGADRALNLDGGGSTTLGVREYGSNQVNLANRPSDGVQRAISTVLQAVSTAPTGAPAVIGAHRSQVGTLLKGASIDVAVDYVLDPYFNTLPYQAGNLSVSVTNGVADATGATVTATNAGNGNIVLSYGNATKTMPIKVVDSIKNLQLNTSSANLVIGQSQTFKATGKDEQGTDIIMPKTGAIQWSVTGGIGEITQNGVFTAKKSGTGTVVATYGNNSVSAVVQVGGGEPVLLSSFDSADAWKSSTARATASLKTAVSPDPVKEGKGSVQLNYDFSAGSDGIAAAYASPAKPISIAGVPAKIGVWVYGDGNKHWLRGKLTDGNGKAVTINFTEEGMLDWTGWKYVEAEVPSAIAQPVTFDQIYVAEAYPERQGKGAVYFDKLQAVYNTEYVEPMFNDVAKDYWAKKEIEYLAQNQIIFGYPDGNFGPGQKLTRTHAAALLVRALHLDTSSVTNPKFTDVPTTHRNYAIIAAVANAGIMNGKGDGTFDPEGNLTRAQMAVILSNAYDLKGSPAKDFKDVVSSYWAHDAINALAANNITTGYPDNTFKPGNTVTRAQYSAFLYRILTK